MDWTTGLDWNTGMNFDTYNLGHFVDIASPVYDCEGVSSYMPTYFAVFK